ncbi:MAG: bifunctional serine/threonine-protein kinase/formylglycine-generating enzyme family protein [Planctomycetota bacterium]
MVSPTNDERPVSGSEDSGISDRLEDLIALGLERAMVDGERGIDSVCRDHPAHADAIRTGIVALREMGFAATPTSRHEPCGRQLGDFQLLRCIGRGGMGEVFVAEQCSLGRRVALKLMRPEALWFDASRDRFRREVESVAHLNHPGIVPVYAVGEQDGVPYFAMELVNGCSLSDALHQLRDFVPERLTGEALESAIVSTVGEESPRESSSRDLFHGTWSEVCLRLTLQVAEALQHAHTHGIVHRDVKPSNIMLTPGGRVRLVDFGLARVDEPSQLTETRSPLGSLPYVSPEQLVGDARQIDHRTDIYGLGVTLYELLTLRVPYLSQSYDETRRLTVAGNPTRVRTFNPAVPWDAETICLVAMDRDRERRYATAADLATDIRRALQHLPLAARRPGVPLRTYRWAQRHPRLSVAAVLLPIAIIVLAFTLRGWLRSDAIAAERLAEVYRLADARLASVLVASAEDLWPAVPENAASMAAWLEEARALADRLAGYREELRRLRERALPYDAASEQHDRETHPRADELTAAQFELDKLLESAPLTEDAESQIDAKRNEIDALEHEVGTRRTWQYSEPADQRKQDQLAAAVSGLAQLVGDEFDKGLIANVSRRLAWARDVVRLTIEQPAAAWTQAIAEIADPDRCPAYHGLVIAPQIGLVPLGRDRLSGLWEFYQPETGTAPERSLEGKLQLTPENGVVLVLIPGGWFLMGAQSADRHDSNFVADASYTEAPVHRIDLDAFFISKYELTIAQWVRATGQRPTASGLGDTCPVEKVSWNDCLRVVQHLGLALPTEAQWEYAARAGTATAWWTGNDKTAIKEAGNIADRACASRHAIAGAESWDDGFENVAPVGSLRPNGFGLHDVIGNVSEWCRDRHATYGGPVRPGDGLRITSVLTYPICRGGSFLLDAWRCRSMVRSSAPPHAFDRDLGLRPVRPLTK